MEKKRTFRTEKDGTQDQQEGSLTASLGGLWIGEGKWTPSAEEMEVLDQRKERAYANADDDDDADADTSGDLLLKRKAVGAGAWGLGPSPSTPSSFDSGHGQDELVSPDCHFENGRGRDRDSLWKDIEHLSDEFNFDSLPMDMLHDPRLVELIARAFTPVRWMPLPSGSLQAVPTHRLLSSIAVAFVIVARQLSAGHISKEVTNELETLKMPPGPYYEQNNRSCKNSTSSIATTGEMNDDAERSARVYDQEQHPHSRHSRRNAAYHIDGRFQSQNRRRIWRNQQEDMEANLRIQDLIRLRQRQIANSVDLHEIPSADEVENRIRVTYRRRKGKYFIPFK